MMTRRWMVLAAAIAAVATVGACVPPPQPSAQPNPLTLGQNDQLGNAPAHSAVINANGNWVAFGSSADNLVPGGTPGADAVYLRNRQTGSVVRVREGGSQPSISTNGRYVGYRAPGSVLGVYDRVTGQSTEWTTNLSTARSPVVAADGSAAVYGAFGSFGIFAAGCRVHDLVTGVDENCPQGGAGFGVTALEAISPNARFVLYSWIDQSGGETSARLLWDRQDGTTIEVTQPVLAFGNSTAISNDGRYVAAIDVIDGTGIVPIVHDLETGADTPFPFSPGPDTTTAPIDLSGDGSTVLVLSSSDALVPGDTNEAFDMFLWRHSTGVIGRISATSSGQQLSTDTLSCGSAPGQLRANGTVGCILTPEPLVAADTNGVVDAYLMGPTG